ncbi:MAG TPA: NAD-dependent malic enzyme, partial [Pseudolabrys sp.]|nr:NAD-dependent malic enzyme [Pseudolabrys sp.]
MEMPLNVNTPPNAVDLPRGVALLRDPLLNKGTAFSEKERDALGLRGLLPAHLLSQEEQVARILTNLRRLPDDLEKYVALNALHDRNEALFFRVVCDNIDEIQPLIYT